MKIDFYAISLDIDDRAHTFSGREDITLETDTDYISLDSVDLTVMGVSVDGKPWKCSTTEKEIRVPGLAPGKHVITVEFGGSIGPNLTGLYLAKTRESEMFTTQFESTGARRVFPCIDNPAYKAEFDLELKIDSGLEAISNMPVESSRNVDGKKVVKFARTPRMSTYLLYIGVGEFDSRKRKYGDREIILSAPRGHLSPTDFPLEVAEKCLSLFEDYFGIPYMLPKMHLISVPEFAAGAMENWGALTFREILLYAADDTGSLTRKRIASVIAHEIAHQWFGDLVTMKWWNDLWLNESFATFMAYKMVNEIYPEMDPYGEMIGTRTSPALMDDSLVNSHPIDVEVNDPNSVAQIFDQISYGKGASVLRMMEHFVGRDNFRNGIRVYLKEHSYSNAKGEDLWSSIEKVSGMPVSRIMEAWVRKQGYPVVEVSEDGDSIKVTQKRFLISSSGDDTWPIPLTVLRKDGVESIVLDSSEGSLPSHGFIKVNSESSGFYRVLYSAGLLENALNNLERTSYLDRWGMLNDYYSFLLAGRISLEDYVGMLRKFRSERNHLVIEEIASQLLRLNMKAPDNPLLKQAAVSAMTGYLEAIGSPVQGEEMNVSILRGSLSHALAILDRGFADSLSGRFERLGEVPPDLRGAVVLSYAVSRNDLQGMLKKMESAGNDEERVRIIGALGWLRDRESLEKVNRMVLEGEIKRQDCMSFFSSLAASPGSRDFSFEHLEETIEFLKRTFSGSRRASAALESIVPLVGMGRKDSMLELLDRLISPETEKGILKGKELLEINEKFREKYGNH